MTLPADAHGNIAAPAAAPETYALVEQALLARWPESRIDPTLDRMRALCDLMGDPQTNYPVIEVTGTNGKTSTARIIDALLRRLGLRTGRFTSPHLESMTERICIDGEPVSAEGFVRSYADVLPYADVVDRSGPHRLSFFEFVTGMAYSAFADAPVDVAVTEVGLGGTWDTTNVADAQVAVITPIALDHERYLGDSIELIATEKAGVIKRDGFAVLADQDDSAAAVLLERVREVGAIVAREGAEFAVESRTQGLGGQVVTIRGLARHYEEMFLPLHGAHQAQNAACAIAAVEAFVGGIELDDEAVREALAQVDSPGRMEVVRRSPSVVLDAAHNPAGAATTAEAMQEAFAFSPLIGVLGVMADKDVEGVLAAFEPVLAQIVCTQNSTARSMPAAELAEIAEGIYGEDRVHLRPRLDDALDLAVGLAEQDSSYGAGGVLVTGSVITVGQARALLGRAR